MNDYAELQVASSFSFLRGAAQARELAERAAALGYHALALTDWDTLSGIVMAHSAMKKSRGGRFLVGCRLNFTDRTALLCYPTDRAAYGRLTRLLTLGRRRAGKGRCELHFRDALEYSQGQRYIIPCPTRLDATTREHIARCVAEFGDRVHLALTPRYRGDDRRWLATLADFARAQGIALVATNDVLYHLPERKPLQDVMTCIREKCTLAEAGFRLEPNAERYLKGPEEMARLFAQYPAAIAATLEIAAACRFSLDELRYEYPEEIVEPGLTPFETLRRRTLAGAARRYPNGIPSAVLRQIRHELQLIEERNYAPYFLTVHEIVRFAESRGILHQGRGSAANSVVCYCLHITQVDPVARGLLFERFISAARDEPPDIDVDFEHERREEVIQHIYATYGRERAGLTATVVHYRTKRAIREVGKVLGLSESVTGALAALGGTWHDDALTEAQVRETGLDPHEPKLALALRLAKELTGFPRHLSQHVGGFVMARGRLDELVPVENATMADRTVVQWEKDDLDELGMMKVDILALGMLTAIRKSFALLAAHYGRHLTLASVPPEDPAVYEMLSRADSVGVFQVESRAQQSMLPRLKPRCFYDLVIEVAIVRPGPIQGDMVHPYLRRREGKEAVEYPSEALRQVLEKTLGVPLFQEQAMQIAIRGAGFTPTEADQLRRALATFRHVGTISTFRDRFLAGMRANGYSDEYARRCFSQIEGFGTYGFPESHAISFANLVYVSAWLKCHYPEVFCAGLLNSQPMGFYAPAQLVRDARDHGVTVRPVDVNASDWDATLEPAAGERRALRLGLRMINGLPEEAARKIVAARGEGYASAEEVSARSACGRAVMEKLAHADAMGSLRLGRRQALWQAGALRGAQPPLFAAAKRDLIVEPAAELPPLAPSQEVVNDYVATGLSLRAHPLAFLRERLRAWRVTPAAELGKIPPGRVVTVAGLVLCRQQPMTAHDTVFITLEDETGCANLIAWKQVHERHRRALRLAKLMGCRGVVQREGQVVHVIVNHIWDWTAELTQLSERGQPPAIPVRSRDFH